MGNADGRTGELTLEHQQVIAFVGSYLREYGCLPTPAETATGCGFRSSHTAARRLGELEAAGVLRRDPTYNRLGSIDIDQTTPAVDAADQLWLCERACIEYRANLDRVRIGLGFAPEPDVVGSLHAEGVNRVAVLRAFTDARDRLHEGGAALDAGDVVALREQEDVAGAATELVTDWASFSIVQLVWSLSAHQWLCGIDPLQLGYLGSSFVASRRTIESLLPTYWSRSAGPLATDPRVQELIKRLTELLDAVRRGIGDHYPSPEDRLHVDVADLLAL